MSTPSNKLVNNLYTCVAQDTLCTAFAVKLLPTTEVISIAKSAGYDSIFVELEHSALSLSNASQLCAAAISCGITPFVRVPYQCGDGFVQRVLDGGAMGVIFPHIYTVEDAKAAVSICKFSPAGRRSLTAALPHFAYAPTPASEIIQTLDSIGSTVFLMVETQSCLDNIEDIAAVPGVEVLLVGANDLTQELGILGQWDHPKFLAALERVGKAAQAAGKIFGLAGLYTRPDLATRAIDEFGARYMLGSIDIACLTAGARQNVAELRSLKSSKNEV